VQCHRMFRQNVKVVEKQRASASELSSKRVAYVITRVMHIHTSPSIVVEVESCDSGKHTNRNKHLEMPVCDVVGIVTF